MKKCQKNHSKMKKYELTKLFGEQFFNSNKSNEDMVIEYFKDKNKL